MNNGIGSAAHQALVMRRKRKETRFKLYGLSAIVLSLLFLVCLFISIISKGYSTFTETKIQLSIPVNTQTFALPDLEITPKVLATAHYEGAVLIALKRLFPEVQARKDIRALKKLISDGAAYDLRDAFRQDAGLWDRQVGQDYTLWVNASSLVDGLMKGQLDRDLPESLRKITDQQIVWVDHLVDQGLVKQKFNFTFLSSGDSREPEMAGVWGALVGSLLTMAVTLILSLPVGIATAIYLEEFAPKNRWVDLIEVNINNLAAVPSIVYGLLGLAVFINFFGLPRSAPLVGGLVLTLMTLPIMIIASRAAITSVPPSIREAALGMGASKVQTVMHHVLPLALPGMLTGAIIGMARALGETAPLLMIGMVAFVVDIPQSVFDPSTALPVQIFLWADNPERAFIERTSAAIMVLLVFMVMMNVLAVILRKRFERRW